MKASSQALKDVSSLACSPPTLTRFLRFTRSSVEDAYQRFVRRKKLPEALAYPSLRERLLIYSLLLAIAVILAAAGYTKMFFSGKVATEVSAFQGVGLIWLICVTLALLCLVHKFNAEWRLCAVLTTLLYLASVATFSVLDSSACSYFLSAGFPDDTLRPFSSVVLITVGNSYLLLFDSMLYAAASAASAFVYLGINVISMHANPLSAVLESISLTVISLAIARRLYSQELSLRKFYIEEIHEEPTPSKTRSAAHLPTPSLSVATDWEDILARLQSASTVLSEACSFIPYHDLRGKLKAVGRDLGTVTAKLMAEGPNIFQVKVEHINQEIDKEDKLFVQQNFMKVDPNSASNSQKIVMQANVSPGLFLEYELSELVSALNHVGKNWNFDMFFIHEMTENKSLSVLGRFSINKFSLSHKLEIPDVVAAAYFRALEQEYNPNPYHNSCHAADVLSSTLFLVHSSDVMEHITDLELLGTIIASLGHDVGHPALTNRYLINSRADLALTYNDISVLEMMHAAKTFSIMKEEGRNLLKGLEEESWAVVRKIIVKMIIATDMSRHFDLLGTFKSTHSAGSISSLNKAEERLAVLEVIIKCADIAHAAKSTDLHERWTVLVCEEFFQQGDREKQLGLPVSMYCDRDTTDIAKSQMGFIQNIVMPLFESLNAFLTAGEIEKCCVRQLRENMAYWEKKTTHRRRFTYKAPRPTEERLSDYLQLSSKIRQPKRCGTDKKEKSVPEPAQF